MNSVKMQKRPLFFSNVCLRYIQKKTLNVFVIYLLVKSLTIISGFVCNATKILKEFLLFLRATYILFLHTKIKNWRCNVQTKCNPLTTQKSSFFKDVYLHYIQKKTLNT